MTKQEFYKKTTELLLIVLSAKTKTISNEEAIIRIKAL